MSLKELNEQYFKTVERVFQRCFGEDNAEVSNAVLRVFVDNEQDRELAGQLANLLYLEPPRDEVASDQFLRFVEVAEDLDDSDFSEEFTSDDDSDDDESDEEDDSEEDDDEDEDDDSDGEVNAIDDDGRSLKVLVTPDSHKFAAKVFHQMLGNEDLSRYPAFMMDMDRFLSQYKNNSPAPKNVDIASILGINIEIAKKSKSPRGAFLSKLMGYLSSDAGNKMIDAYSKGDVDGFADAFGDVITKLIEDMPEGEGQEEDVSDIEEQPSETTETPEEDTTSKPDA